MSTFLKKIKFFTNCFLLLFTLTFNAQSNMESYKSLWELIQADTINSFEKINLLEKYIHKSKLENNDIELFKGLVEKSFYVDLPVAERLIFEAEELLINIKNDSIKGDFLNTKSSLYYQSRFYKQALYFGIASEEYNFKNKCNYCLNFGRVIIANIYYHTKSYDNAKLYYEKVVKFNESHSYAAHISMNTAALFGLGKTNWKLNDLNSFKNVIDKLENVLPKSLNDNNNYEYVYLNILKGGYALLNNDLINAELKFKEALKVVSKSDDFSNEHFIYLNLGKIAWEKNEFDIAVNYFKKVDNLFTNKKFLNYELREAYDYLILDAKNNNNLNDQLKYTEKLNELNKIFEAEQKEITQMLYNDFEAKKLKTNNFILEEELNKNRIFYNFTLIGLAILFTCLVIYTYYKSNQQKKLENQFKILQSEVSKRKEISADISNQIPNVKLTLNDSVIENKSSIANLTEIRLLKLISNFEKEKEFLYPVKLDELADKWATNRNTLSKVFNTHKNGFSVYINKLRIEQLLLDLNQKSELRNLNQQDLAELYGFNNSKTFALQFKNETGLTPSFYIEQLNFLELNS